MSLQAYQKSVSRAEDPRQTEYRLLAQVTHALMEARACERAQISVIAEAVDWNRRVWNAFASDCAVTGNGLPDQIRAGIISLSLFVSKHSSAVVREGAEIDPLIDINKMIMQGLAGAGAGEAAPAGA